MVYNINHVNTKIFRQDASLVVIVITSYVIESKFTDVLVEDRHAPS